MQPDWFDAGWKHIWLPYTQMQTAPLPTPVVGAEGCELQLADGRRLIDGTSSWWTACHGYRHPYLIEKMREQLETLPHVMFGGLAHEPAYRLAKRLIRISPGLLNRVFFTDSGSVAVEVALKMAIQYWRNQGKAGKNKFVSFRHGYHGDTLGAMSVSDPEQNYHQAFRGILPMQYTVAVPSDEYGFAELEEMLSGLHKTIAGCIIEPLVQGAGGMRFHSPDILAEIQRLCARYEILFIADEIATGFGRTGYMFACLEAGVEPDILCLGKALTGGMTTLAATLTTAEVFDGFLSDDPSFALMHGPTYMANPLACSAALASLDLFDSEPRIAQVEAIEQQMLAELGHCRKMPGVVDVRVKGAIGVVQIDRRVMNIRLLREMSVELGVWIRPIEDVIYLTPPFVISSEQLSKLTGAVAAMVTALAAK